MYRTPSTPVERKFQVGDIVRHRAGGPAMVIDKIDESSRCPFWCSWFNQNDDQQQEWFSIVEIELADPPPPGQRR